MKHVTLRSRRGYTLTELVAVIAILAILVTLSATGYIALRKTLRITEYDDIAREIYIAAQNRLTSAYANGLSDDNKATLQGGTTMGTAQPADYDADASGVAWSNVGTTVNEKTTYNYYYADNTNTAILKLLLPLGSVDDTVRSNGYYVIEYNASTGMVYGVFYSESEFNYTTVNSVTNIRTSQDARKSNSPMVGYYGGSAVERDNLGTCAAPELKIENTDILQLTVANRKDNTGCDVTITISDGTNTVTIEEGTTAGKYSPTTGTLLLDSLESGSHFKDIFSGTGLTPGADLTITVTFSQEGCLSSSASVTVNSLFASAETVSDENGANAATTVEIEYARHLQNLDKEFSGVSVSGKLSARQIADIDWATVSTSAATSTRSTDFTSITNTSLTAYDGQYYLIKNLKGENGLFASVSAGTQLSSVRIVNPTISAGAGTNPVGALVGTAGAGTTVKNCGVYCDATTTTGGVTTVDYTSYKTKGYGITAPSATAGGLIGKAASAFIEESFAALPFISAKAGGALVGSATSCQISLSYAACDELDERGTVAYFLSGSNNTINKCYAVGNIANSENGSFALESNTITASYYAVSHTDYSAETLQSLFATEYVTYAGENNSNSKTKGQKTDNYNYAEFLENIEKDLGSDFGANGLYDCFSSVTAPLTHPYREGLNGRAYPYPGFYRLEHYGSWPTDDGLVTVQILMRYLTDSDNSESYRYSAGRVQVYELGTDESGETTGELLFDNVIAEGETYVGSYLTVNGTKYKVLSNESDAITFSVIPGTKLKIVAEATNSDYTFAGIQVGTISVTNTTYETTVSLATTVIVRFQAKQLTLTAQWPTESDTVQAYEYCDVNAGTAFYYGLTMDTRSDTVYTEWYCDDDSGYGYHWVEDGEGYEQGTTRNVGSKGCWVYGKIPATETPIKLDEKIKGYKWKDKEYVEGTKTNDGSSTYGYAVTDKTIDETFKRKTYWVQYSTTAGNTALLYPEGSVTGVSESSEVTVYVNYPEDMPVNEWIAAVTYTYTKNAETVTQTVPQDANGNYTFAMPSTDTTINVSYAKRNDKVAVSVQYWVQNTNGVYEISADKSSTVYFDKDSSLTGEYAEKLFSANFQSEIRNQEANYEEQQQSYDSFVLLNGETEEASTRDEDTANDTYTFQSTGSYTLKVYVKRKTYTLTLAIGEKIESVTMTYTDEEGNTIKKTTDGTKTVTTSTDASGTVSNTEESSTTGTVSAELYFGQSVTASAQTEAGQSFTVWSANDSRAFQSPSASYAFSVPYYNLTLTASAEQGKSLVTLELTENGESWLASSDSRTDNPVTLTLVSTKNENDTVTLENLGDKANSYMAQGLVQDLGVGYGYYIQITYKNKNDYVSEYYMDDNGDPVVVRVRGKAVTQTVAFYTVTYNVEEGSGCTGTVPTGGTYPANANIHVAGNPGQLTNKNKYLIGWRDEYATDLSKVDYYIAGAEYTVTGKTYFFPEWAASDKVDVAYSFGGITGITGELPIAVKNKIGSTYTVEECELTRAGYKFAGWVCSYTDCTYIRDDEECHVTTSHRHQAGDVITITYKLTLTAAWDDCYYSVFYHGNDQSVKVTDNSGNDGRGYKISDTVTLKNYEDSWGIGTGMHFVGWATTPTGSVSYAAGETITGLTENMNLYPVFADTMLRVTYHYTDANGNSDESTQDIGYGASAVLNPGKDGTWTVTAWSENELHTGANWYPCQEGTAHTVNSYTLSSSQTKVIDGVTYYTVNLYAVTENVYNYIQQTWYDTLYDAVNGVDNAEEDEDGNSSKPAAAAGDTLIVYRDTTETQRIEFTKELGEIYVVASGDRTVKWDDCTASDLKYTRAEADKDATYIGENEFCGCMFINDCAVTFGDSDKELGVSGTLTFDANQKSRVMALKGSSCVFTMVDGVTLTNGLVYSSSDTGENARKNPQSRQYFGGGVYAADGAYFKMEGGVISNCTAKAGGGVYIVGVWTKNKWGKTEFSNYSYSAGASFSMGDMENPKYYAPDKIYYVKVTDNGTTTYQMANGTGEITADSFEQNPEKYYVTTGNPQIIYNTAKKANHSDGGGGVVLLEVDAAALNLFSGEISNNTAENLNGGGIILDTSENYQELRLYEIEISHNTAANGGGIFQYQGTTWIYNADILQNKATSNGGGIYATCAITYKVSNLEAKGNYEVSEILFYYGTIRGNQAVGNKGDYGLGGGIYLATPDSTSAVCVTVEAGQILNNSAYSGGGIYVSPAASVSKNGNTGNIYGTVDYAYTVMAIVNGGEIRNNSTDRAGGGIYLNETSQFYLNGGYFSDNMSEFNNKKPSSLFTSDENYYCDIYLSGTNSPGKNYVKINTSAKNLAEELENDSDDPIYLMCYQPKVNRIVVNYENVTPNSIEADADCFEIVYGPSGFSTATPLYVTPDSSRTALILSSSAKTNLTVSFNYTDGSGNVAAYTETGQSSGNKILYSTVYDKVSDERTGYDLVGWAKSEDAELEDYVIYYQNGVIYMSYNESSKCWMYKYDNRVWYRRDISDTDTEAWTYKAEYNNGSWTWQKLDGEEWVEYVDTESKFTNEINELASEGAPAYTVTSAYSQQLYAIWEPYSVVYELGSVPSDVTMEQTKQTGPKLKLSAPDTNEYTVDNITYTFVGWSLNQNQTEPGTYGNYSLAKENFGTEIELSESITLYAVWQPSKMTIIYAPNGGSIQSDSGLSGIYSELVDYGKVAVAWNNVYNDRTAYAYSKKTLAGWAKTADGEIVYKIGDTILAVDTKKSSLMLYAVWETPVNVKYTGAGTNSLEQQTSYEGGTVTVVAPSERSGYVFAGWQCSYSSCQYTRNGEEQEAETSHTHLVGDVITVGASDLTLTAVWQIKVTFDTGGVVLTDVYTKNKDGTYTLLVDETESDKEITLPTLTMDGYTLTGWTATEKAEDGTTSEIPLTSTEENESGNAVYKYTVTVPVTFAAQWQSSPVDSEEETKNDNTGDTNGESGDGADDTSGDASGASLTEDETEAANDAGESGNAGQSEQTTPVTDTTTDGTNNTAPATDSPTETETQTETEEQQTNEEAGTAAQSEGDGTAAQSEEDGTAAQSENDGTAAQSEEDGIAAQSENDGIATQSEDVVAAAQSEEDGTADPSEDEASESLPS